MATLQEIKLKATEEYIKRTTSKNFQTNISLEDGKIYKLISTMVDSISASLTGGGGGEANTASNVGTGEGEIFRNKVGVDLTFKTLKAGSNVTITNNINEIVISAVSIAVAINMFLLTPNSVPMDIYNFTHSLSPFLI